jgi:hypothetical protein
LLGIFAYEVINADNYVIVHAENKSFAKDDFKIVFKE